MMILRTATIFAIFMKCLTASAFNETELGMAINGRDFETIKKSWEENWGLQGAGLNYVLRTEEPEFIVSFIKQVGIVNGKTLAKLYTKASKETVEEVLKAAGFCQRSLAYAASESELMDSPKIIVELLNKVMDPEAQKSAIKHLVRGEFFDGRIDRLDALLAALGGEQSLNKGLKDIAIQEIFKNGAEYRSGVWTKRFYDDPAITSDVYADGLFASYREYYEEKLPVFKWLLAAASHEDLRAAGEKCSGWNYRDSGLRFYIEDALSTAARGKTRLGAIGPNAKAAKQVFEDSSSAEVSEAIKAILSAYVTEDMDDAMNRDDQLRLHNT